MSLERRLHHGRTTWSEVERVAGLYSINWRRVIQPCKKRIRGATIVTDVSVLPQYFDPGKALTLVVYFLLPENVVFGSVPMTCATGHDGGRAKIARATVWSLAASFFAPTTSAP